MTHPALQCTLAKKYYALAELVPTVLILKSGVYFNINVKCSAVNVLSGVDLVFIDLMFVGMNVFIKM